MNVLLKINPLFKGTIHMPYPFLKKSFFSLSLALSCFSLPANAQKVAFRVNLSPVGNFNVESDKIEGSVVAEGEKFILNTATLVLDSLKSGVDLRDEHMKKKYFEIEKFPNAKMTKAEGSGGTFKGTLEVHGVSKEISGVYEVKGNEVTAKFTTKMSDFNIPKAIYMGVGAKDEIAVEVSLPLVKSTASN